MVSTLMVHMRAHPAEVLRLPLVAGCMTDVLLNFQVPALLEDDDSSSSTEGEEEEEEEEGDGQEKQTEESPVNRKVWRKWSWFCWRLGVL